MLYLPDISKEPHLNRIAEAEFIISATHFEQSTLQKEYVNVRKLVKKWNSEGSFIIQIGEVDGKAIVANFSFFDIDGSSILFTNSSSKLFDQEMLEKFTNHYNKSEYTDRKIPARTNALNFAYAYQKIKSKRELRNQ